MGAMSSVTGSPGFGKTEVAQYMVNKHFRCYLVTATPTCSTPTAIMREICRVANVPTASAIARVRETLQDHLGGDKIALIIVDESQHLRLPALEEIRGLHDVSGCGVVLMGNNSVITRFSGQGRSSANSQLTSRIAPRATLPATPKVADIMLMLDAMKVTDPQERKFLTTVAQGEGAFRTLNKTVQLARLQKPDDHQGTMLPLYRSAAGMLSTQMRTL